MVVGRNEPSTRQKFSETKLTWGSVLKKATTVGCRCDSTGCDSTAPTLLAKQEGQFESSQGCGLCVISSQGPSVVSSASWPQSHGRLSQSEAFIEATTHRRHKCGGARKTNSIKAVSHFVYPCNRLATWKPHIHSVKCHSARSLFVFG